MLPGTMAGQFPLNEMEIDLQSLAARAGAKLILADVASVNLNSRMLTFADGNLQSFDVLSIGAGSIPAGIPNTEAESLIPVKPMQLFLQRLDERIKFLVQKPVRNPQITVIGGGVASIEIALCLRTRLQIHFPTVNFGIRILTSGDEIAPEVSKSSIRKVRRILHLRGVEVQTNSRVTEVLDSGITINGVERQSADCVIWSTGATGPPVLARLGLPLDENGFLVTTPTLQSVADPTVFAVGDSGSVAGTPFPKAGVYAVRQSPVLWHNLKSLLIGGAMKSFTPQRSFLKLLNTGDGRAILIYRSLTIHARWCWILKTWIDRRFVRRFH